MTRKEKYKSEFVCLCVCLYISIYLYIYIAEPLWFHGSILSIGSLLSAALYYIEHMITTFKVCRGT